MRYLVCIPDGCADIGDDTPLEVANMPTLAELAGRGLVGSARTIPPGMAPASDVGIMSILGYDPLAFHTGRAPIEAAALGVTLPAGRIAFRCNLVTVADDGTMLDFTGGRPGQQVAERLFDRLRQNFGDTVTFHPGLSYRHIVTVPAEWAEATCVPPHELVGQRVVAPYGPRAGRLAEIMDASRRHLRDDDTTATQVWLWGQGPRTMLPDFRQRWGLTAELVAAVGVARGLGVLTGMRVPDVDGATGWLDTDYAAKRDAAISAFEHGADLVVVHVAATDEAGHAGDRTGKVRALEDWDRHILSGLVRYLDAVGPWGLLLLPDHATPWTTRVHTDAAVPYLLFNSRRSGPGGLFGERTVAEQPQVCAGHLLRQLVGR